MNIDETNIKRGIKMSRSYYNQGKKKDDYQEIKERYGKIDSDLDNLSPFELSRYMREISCMKKNLKNNELKEINNLLYNLPNKIKGKYITPMINNRQNFEKSFVEMSQRNNSIKKIAFFLAKSGFKTHQIRKYITLFNKIKFKLDSLTLLEFESQINQIITNAIYMAGRNSNRNGSGEFSKLLWYLVEIIQNELNKTKNDNKINEQSSKIPEEVKLKFLDAFQIIQGITAHHKLYGGKD